MALTNNILHENITIALMDSVGVVAYVDTSLPCTIQHQYVWTPQSCTPNGLSMITELYHGTNCIGLIDMTPYNPGMMQITFIITAHTISLHIRKNTIAFRYTNLSTDDSNESPPSNKVHHSNELNPSNKINHYNELNKSMQRNLHRRHQALLMCMNASTNIECNYTNPDKQSVMNTLRSIKDNINQVDCVDNSHELMKIINHLEKHYNCMQLDNSWLGTSEHVVDTASTDIRNSMLYHLCIKKHACCDILDAAYQCMTMHEAACAASHAAVLQSELSGIVAKFNVHQLCSLDERSLFQLAQYSQSEIVAFKEDLYNSLFLINNAI